MARQVRRFSVTVAPGSSPAAPVSSALALPTMTVDEVQLRIPPGPSGALGVALAIAGQQIIPYQSGEWIVGDDERIDWPLDDFPDSGDWSLLAYNNGSYPHTVQVSFLLSLLAQPLQLPPLPISAALLVPDRAAAT